MAHPYLRKTLLALAIATSQPLFADAVNLTGSQTRLYSNDYSAPLTITGHASGEDYAVDLNSSGYSIFPSTTNLATLNASGEQAKTLALSGSSIPHPLFGMEVMMGDLTNGGQISASGGNSSGIFLGNAAILFSGDLNNSGDIASNGTNAAGIRLSNLASIYSGGMNNTGNIRASGIGATGVSLSSTAHVSQDLTNNGNIRAEGLSAKGIELSAAIVSGYLQNSGHIEAIGASSTAISLESGSSAQAVGNLEGGLISARGENSRGLSIDIGGLLDAPTSLTNHGIIESEGRGSVGVHIDHPQNLSIVANFGKISAAGEDSRAIRLGSGYPDDPAVFYGLQLINIGTLQADGIAIEALTSPANHDPAFSWLQVDMWTGLIAGEEAAIKGDGNVLLNFEGGEIRGDLLGLSEIHASGDALFNGRLIQSPTLWVSSLELGQPHTRLEGNLSLSNSSLDLNLHSQTDPRRAIL
ncbi:hypothetical protein P8H27_01765 [Pseudomonas sp. sp1636]|uniref:hypothetical protein n=1 Tax=Pseudomonas sp. sp1636 TaxID=3036707 RepID=UPI0025A5EC8C|nr:hypothetical protein [Pseudomonas sp. sp1636]MDM8347626.1 hypothetical protein [Pseudomonas sp. sp1636]